MTVQQKMKSHFRWSFLCFMILVFAVSIWSYLDQSKNDEMFKISTLKHYYVSQLRINSQNIYQPFLTLQVDHDMSLNMLENLKESVEEADIKVNEASQSLYLLGLNEDEKNKIDLIEKQIFFLKADFKKLYSLMEAYIEEGYSHEIQHQLVDLIQLEIDYKRMYLDTSLGNFQKAVQENMYLMSQNQSKTSYIFKVLILVFSLIFVSLVQWIVFNQNKKIVHQIKNNHQVILNDISLMKAQTFALKNQLTNPSQNQQDLQKRLLETSQNFDETTKRVLRLSAQIGESFGIETRLK